MEILKGMGLLLFTLGLFSLFSFKAPKGSKAMSGLANAAVATFLVEAIHKYISGNFLGFTFLGKVGSVSGSMGGVAAAILVPISMGGKSYICSSSWCSFRWIWYITWFYSRIYYRTYSTYI